MIQLFHLNPLSQACLDALELYQKEVKDAGGYGAQVVKAKTIWPSKKQNKPFEEVIRHLTDMCSGARRCCYCEDSVADEVEHIDPKDFFPEYTFVWENYLFACGPCNGPKGNKWAIFVWKNGKRTILHLSRNIGEAILEPEKGDPLLINPRKEDPFLFIVLDLIPANPNDKQLKFTEIAEEGTEDYERAKYTIEVLGLNTRQDLASARWNAYTMYRARLAEYCLVEMQGGSRERLAELVKDLKSEGHPTVWREIVRYRKNGWLKGVDARLDGYFDAVPEAVFW